MAFKDVVGGSALDIKKHLNKPLEGYYKGHKDIETNFGSQVIYKFKKKDGETIEVYGFTNLNRAMESVEAGQLCRITYTGTQNVKTKFGMKDVHQVRVEVDEDASVEFDKDINDDLISAEQADGDGDTEPF